MSLRVSRHIAPSFRAGFIAGGRRSARFNGLVMSGLQPLGLKPLGVRTLKRPNTISFTKTPP